MSIWYEELSTLRFSASLFLVYTYMFNVFSTLLFPRYFESLPQGNNKNDVIFVEVFINTVTDGIFKIILF